MSDQTDLQKTDIQDLEELTEYEEAIKPPTVSSEEYMRRPHFPSIPLYELIENDLIQTATVLESKEIIPKSLRELLEEDNLPENITIELPIKFVIPTDNIRALDVEHAHELGIDILKHDQLYPCLGDLDENGCIRIQAGLHRFYGIGNLSNWEGNIRVDLTTRTLTKQEQLQLKRRENLHKDMSTHEKYEVIAKLYDLYISQDESPTKKGFAEFIGYSYDLVLKAIQYKTLPETIKKLVEQNCINVTQALIIAKMEDPNKMVREAVYAINNNLNTEDLESRINNLRSESKNALFTLEYMEDLLDDGNKKHTEQSLRRKASEVKSYYGRLSKMIEILNQENRTEDFIITDTARKYLAEFVFSTIIFMSYLKNKDPKSYGKIVEIATDDIKKIVRAFNLYTNLQTIQQARSRKERLSNSEIYRQRDLKMQNKKKS